MRQEQKDAQDLAQQLDDVKKHRSALSKLIDRERSLREEAGRIGQRERELSAAREELQQHERGLKDELGALLIRQTAEFADHEKKLDALAGELAAREAATARAEQAVAKLQDELKRSVAERRGANASDRRRRARARERAPEGGKPRAGDRPAPV